MPAISITKLYPTYPSSVYMEFTMEDLKRISVPVPTLAVFVERSESTNPLDAWTLVNPTGCDNFFFVDNLPQLLTFNKTFYYRAYFKVGSVKTYSEVRTTRDTLAQKKLWLARRKMLRDEYIVLKKLTGVKFALLKRRHFGARCPKCYDPNTGNVIVSQCTSCYGTGFVNPYYQPYVTYGKRAPRPSNLDSRPEFGGTETDIVKLEFPDFPTIAPQDILIDLDTNDRYKVDSVDKTELRRIVVHQEPTVSLLARTSIEYKYPLSTNILEIPIFGTDFKNLI
jgi:hypothetical protein